MVRLVVNADDLGLHEAIDEGIFRARREGIVTSATLLVTGRTAPEAVRRARAEQLAVGVHLCLSSQLRPALPAHEVPSLAPAGVFRPSWVQVARAFARGKVRLDEVERELRAQVRRARELGAEPDHLDGHQHLHVLPGISAIVRRIAADERLPVRWPRERPTRSWLRAPGAAAKSGLLGALTLLATGTRSAPERRLLAAGAFASGELDEARLLELLERLGDGEHELMCHPGADPGVVPEDPGWRYGWTTELAALCSPRVRERIRARAIELTTYGALFAR